MKIRTALLGFTAMLFSLPAVAADPPWIFGLHDPGGAGIMVEAGKPGWITFTEEIGHNRYATDGPDYTPYTSKGHGIIARLNNGYGQGGTIPYVKHYDDFAQRCANYVAASRGGCHIWIIGNEPNLTNEWPGYEGYIEPITAARYVQCFLKVRAKIKALPGHSGDQVIPAAVGTWAVLPETGDWIDYWKYLLNNLNGQCDALAVHTYTHGTDPNLIFSDVKMITPAGRYYHFRAYKDYLNAVPSAMRSLPVYITETDQDVAWADVNSGWVKNAYKEIDTWNKTSGTQKIRALCLYRWPKVDQWYIDGKWGVINDWREAMANDYRWPTSTSPPPPTVTRAMKVNVSSLNVRSGPSTAYGIIGTVKLNQIYISDTSSSGWYRIWYNGSQGWCSGSYLTQVSGVTAVKVTASALNVRTGPGTTYTIAGQTLLNYMHYRIASSGGWYQIYWGGNAYWVSGAYVTLVTL